MLSGWVKRTGIYTAKAERTMVGNSRRTYLLEIPLVLLGLADIAYVYRGFNSAVTSC